MPRLIIDPFSNCIIVPGTVARQMDTMDIHVHVYVQPGTVTIVTELFLVQKAVLYIYTVTQLESIDR